MVQVVRMKDVKKLRVSTVRFVELDVEVACNNKVLMSGCSNDQERLELIEEGCELFDYIASIAVKLRRPL